MEFLCMPHSWCIDKFAIIDIVDLEITTAVKASVSCISISPPHDNGMRRLKICSTCSSKLNRSKIGTLSVKDLIFVSTVEKLLKQA